MLLVNEVRPMGNDLLDLFHVAAGNGMMKHTGPWRCSLYGKQLLHRIHRVSSG